MTLADVGSALLVLCAALSFPVACRRADMRPVRNVLGALANIDVALWCLLRVLRGASVPYHGALAWALRTDVVLFVAWPGVIAAGAWRVMVGGQRTSRIVLAFLAYGLLLAALYPTIRGPALIAAQGGSRWAGAAIAWVALASRRREGRLTAPEGIACLLAAEQGLSAALGAWQAPVALWTRYAGAGSCVTYAIVGAVLAGLLRPAKRHG